MKKKSDQRKDAGSGKEKQHDIRPEQGGIYASIFNAVNDAIFILGKVTGNILEVNDRCMEMFGYPRSVFPRLTIEDLSAGYAPYDQEHAQRYLQLARDGIPQVFEWKSKDRNEKIFWTEISIRSGKLDGEERLIVLVRDINEAKTQRELLSESRRSLELVINNIPQRIYWKDRNSVYRGGNRWFALDAGLSSSREIPGKTDFDLSWKNKAADKQELDRVIMQSGRPRLNFEELLPTQYGEKIWLRHSKIPITDSEGNINGVLGTYENITAEKQIKESLRQSEQSLKLAMEAANYYIFHLDLVQGRMQISPEFFTSLGYGRDEISGTIEALSGFIHPDDTGTVKQHFRHHLEGNTDSFYVEYRFRSEGGDWIWFSSTGRSLDGPEGRDSQKVTGVMVNIHARKTVQEKIRLLNTELERRVEERTRQLKETMREMEVLSYSVSHDLRAPLRHIQGFAEMLREEYTGQLDKTGQKYLENVLASAGRMNRMIDDLLVFSRAGRRDMNMILFPLGKMFREVAAQQSGMVSKKIKWSIGDLGMVFADPALIRQVVENLVSNAVKYSRHRKLPEITIGRMERENEKIYFIRDNGVGFNMKYAHRLFQVFQRLHPEEKYEGTGVGLASVKQIITRHGGRVWAESNEKQGACFYFTLPRKEE